MGLLKDARVRIAFSMAMFGTVGLFVRNIPLASGEIALYRAMLAILLLSGYFLITGQRIDLASIRRELPLLLISGVAMGVNWILLFEAYRYTTVSVATMSYYFAPVIVTLACPVLFHERMGAKRWICFGMSTLGIVLITGVGDLSAGSDHTKGILFGLGAAVFYASVVLLNKFIKGVAGVQRTFWQFLGAVAILVPYVAVTSGINIGEMDLGGWICLLVVGLFHTGVNYCLYFSALKDVPGQEAAILSYMDPLVAVVVSVFLLGEQLTLLQLVGGLLILGFTLWNELGQEY